MKILVLDNYDSFTYNLVQYIEEILDARVDVRRNDAIDLEEVAGYDTIILSPGPGVPEEAGIMPELLKLYGPDKNILGVCLGHQAIGEAFGASLKNLDQVVHGLSTPIEVLSAGERLFEGVPPVFEGGRYHSWVVNRSDLPECLEVTAVDDAGEIMAFRHKQFNIHGLQFHPESIMTEAGKDILRNFFRYYASEATEKV
ncbi:MAG: aminodeoxychorismate/anthranilate synthase component II [Saprospiraceae bacterium]|jgi:anthranilate synthase component II|nr:aminodeoxychorismate/anthranilate synthase component II [Saprospiraceae bacterium]MDP4999996.1 aminodeoxychorismate/anthranilate synthase component II [Saprospiraceae bacterium]